MIVISYNLESHALAKRIVYAVGTASAGLILQHRRTISDTPSRLKYRFYPHTIHTSTVPVAAESQVAAATQVTVQDTPVLEPRKHGILETDFKALQNVHPKFLDNYLALLNSSAEQIDRKLKWFGWIIDDKLAQLDAAQAELFEKMENDNGDSIHAIIETFKTTGQPFERLEKFYQEVQARFRPSAKE